MPAFLFDGPEDAALTVALAHGAGAGMDTPFMTFFAEGLGAAGYRVARFEFPYMSERRATGKKRPPDRAPILLDTWRSVIETLGPERLVVAGKSMGCRIASMVADEKGVRGLVCLGYPFHAPGKWDSSRIEHLKALRTPTLILQGTRDPFGNRDEVPGYDLSAAIRVHWMEEGGHGFETRKSSGRTESENRDEGLATFTEFLTRV